MKKFIPVLMLGALVACSEEEVDNVAPEFVDIELNGEHDEIEVNTGTDLLIEAVAIDDEGVAEIKVDIHEAFDNHGHGKVNGTAWSFLKVYNTSGTRAEISDSPTIPIDALSGMYHAVFQVIDESGNEGEFEELELVLINASTPDVTVTAPMEDDMFTLGDSITMQGSIVDTDGLQEVVVLLRHHEEDEDDDHGHHHAHVVDEMDWDWASNHPTNWDISNVSMVIPAGEEAGEYDILILAMDLTGNQAVYHVEIEVAE